MRIGDGTTRTEGQAPPRASRPMVGLSVWTFRWKAGGLDAEGLQIRVGASALTLGGLLKHLARSRGRSPSSGDRPLTCTDIGRGGGI
jgi:hypothetical protein